MVNCIIVDDEPLARQLIVSYIDQINDIQCVGICKTALEAFEVLHSQLVDVLFLDINMPGISGINFVRSLKTCPKVIFITAHAEFAVEAFEIEAVDYLVKPVTFDRFLKAVQKIILPESIQNVDKLSSEISSIFLKVERRLIHINLAEVYYIEGMGDYLKVHTIKRMYVTYMTMQKIELLLPQSKFIRIHRSTIINTKMIQYVEGNSIVINNIQLAIGLTFRDSLFKKLG